MHIQINVVRNSKQTQTRRTEKQEKERQHWLVQFCTTIVYGMFLYKLIKQFYTIAFVEVFVANVTVLWSVVVGCGCDGRGASWHWKHDLRLDRPSYSQATIK